MSIRTSYSLNLFINGKHLSRVIIDSHYKENHPDINDKLILDIVKTMDGMNFNIESATDSFEYFVYEPVYNNKSYRLICLFCIMDDYLGVVNAFRIKRKKK